MTKFDEIEIPQELEPLVNDIAEEIHHSWVALRLGMGFRFGEKADYEKKVHPHVRPWKDLPESHRESDLIAARSAIQVMMGKGVLDA